ncbi:Noncompact myelin-associated protein isoform X1 [Aix galericulata]|nr:Noncompact myelin-associated protein isoform X1 [Aix galericulata]
MCIATSTSLHMQYLKKSCDRFRSAVCKSLASPSKMTTAAPLINNTQFTLNVTTKSQEQSLYQSSGAIVAAIVVGVIIIFTVVLLILKTYNRRMRVKRELEPKSTKTAMPPALGQNSDSVTQHPVVTFIPVDIHMQSRQL